MSCASISMSAGTCLPLQHESMPWCLCVTILRLSPEDCPGPRCWALPFSLKGEGSNGSTVRILHSAWIQSFLGRCMYLSFFPLMFILVHISLCTCANIPVRWNPTWTCWNEGHLYLASWYCTSLCSVVCDSATPRTIACQASLCPWDLPGKNTGICCHFLLQGISLIQELKLCLLHLLFYRWIFYHLGSPRSW